jgi:adenylate cyclase
MDCAVLFADVAGSTALYEVLGDERAFALVDACLTIMADCAAEAQGRVVKTIGDAVLAVFPVATAAAAAAIEMQRRVEAYSPAPGVRLGLRIGFRFGPVVERDRDVFGDTVNLASRLCDLASRGQIVTDSETARALGERFRPELCPLYAIAVKGKQEEVDLVELAWQAPGNEKTIIVAARPGSATAKAWLELRLDGQQLVMGPERRKVTIGRDLEADFVIRERSASRAHAMIERRRERFVLADHSANGCFVSFEGRPEIRVHHEELTLVGHGWISVGLPRGAAVQEIEFRCVESTAAAQAPS